MNQSELRSKLARLASACSYYRLAQLSGASKRTVYMARDGATIGRKLAAYIEAAPEPEPGECDPPRAPESSGVQAPSPSQAPPRVEPVPPPPSKQERRAEGAPFWVPGLAGIVGAALFGLPGLVLAAGAAWALDQAGEQPGPLSSPSSGVPIPTPQPAPSARRGIVQASTGAATLHPDIDAPPP